MKGTPSAPVDNTKRMPPAPAKIYDMQIMMNSNKRKISLAPGFAELRDYFYRSVKDEVEQRVWFINPVGTRIVVCVAKMNYIGLLMHGIHNILNHYSLTEGVWIKATYKGETDFQMRVKDLNLHEV
ncbi:hypothetical protein VNO78_17805 [Psophocarpus tetragonolobus]|uniref:Uncharacterized protein n=1 Tax=Psophocarpus tetragonolobus TaxID=3891 RepID=A0AAN9SI79_PSOTE